MPRVSFAARLLHTTLGFVLLPDLYCIRERNYKPLAEGLDEVFWAQITYV